MSGILKTKSFAFALSNISLYKKLIENKKEFIMSKQLLRSATSVGANVRESQNAESKMDFIHKLSIAQKEGDESLYWLELLFQSNYINQQEFEIYMKEGEEILKILRSVILTTKQNLGRKL